MPLRCQFFVLAFMLTLPIWAQDKDGEPVPQGSEKNKVLVLELKNEKNIYWKSSDLPIVTHANGTITITSNDGQEISYPMSEVARFYPSDNENLHVEDVSMDDRSIIIDGKSVYFHGHGCLYNLEGLKIAEGQEHLTVTASGVYILINSKSSVRILLQ